MICTSIKLLTPNVTQNSIGVVKKYAYTEKQVPIIKVEDIYSNEFYEASQLGLKPELRVKISATSYNNERELKYNGTLYTIIRTSTPNIDEIVLICERKIDSGKIEQATISI